MRLFFRKLGGGICGEDVKTFCKAASKFREIRIVCGNKGAEVGVMDDWGSLDENGGLFTLNI